MAHAFEGCHQGHVHPQREVSETSTELDPFTITVTPDMTATYLASASSSSSPLITHVPTVGELDQQLQGRDFIIQRLKEAELHLRKGTIEQCLTEGEDYVAFKECAQKCKS
ncbi:hypothetical protein ACEPPN_013345 [Leptodophora sp. 'Broadleaf-Isolate-01']